MRTSILAIFLALGTLTTQAFGQTILPKEDPFIEVTGTAEFEVIPDEIYISITLREKLDNKTKTTIDVQEKNLKSALAAIGIKMEDLMLTDAKADFVKIKWQKNDVVNQKEYTLKVGTAETVAKVFAELDKLGIKDAYIARVDHSKKEEFKRQVKIDAIKAAKDKAEYLTAAIGYKAGMPLQIREESVPYYPVYGNILMKATAEFDSLTENALPELQFEKMKFQANIYVKFQITK